MGQPLRKDVFCSNGNHTVTNSAELMLMPTGALVCRSCLREKTVITGKQSNLVELQALLQDLYGNIQINQELQPRFISELKATDFRVRLGKVIDHLQERHCTRFKLINFTRMTSKHETMRFKLEFQNKDGNKKQGTFFVKFLKIKRAEMEELTHQFLDRINLPRAQVFQSTWQNNEVIYISPEYLQTFQPWDTEPFSETETQNLRKQFAKVLAAWYLFGKSDYIHNQLISTFQDLHLVQIDHENTGMPLSFFTHPKALDYNKIGQLKTKKEQQIQVEGTLDLLRSGYKSNLSESLDGELKTDFLQNLTKLVKQLKHDHKLHNIVENKLLKGNAIGWHSVLNELIRNHKTVFVDLFGSEVLQIKSLASFFSSFRQTKWKSYAHRHVIDLWKNDREQGKKERQKIIEEFPHEFRFQDLETNLNQIEQCLSKMEERPVSIHKTMSFLKNQIELSFRIWRVIMLEGKVIDLAEKNVVR